MDVDKLQEALIEDTSSAMRKALRPLAQHAIERCISTTTIEETFIASPIVGDGSDQLKVTPTHSGLVMSLDMTTLAHIAYSFAEHRDIADRACQGMLDAIREPDRYGYKTASTKSKTGWIFGHHCAWNDDLLPSLQRAAREHTHVFVKGLPEWPADTANEHLCILAMIEEALDELPVSYGTFKDDILDMHLMSAPQGRAFEAAFILFEDDSTVINWCETIDDLAIERRQEFRDARDRMVKHLSSKPYEEKPTPSTSMPSSGSIALPEDTTIVDAVLSTQGLPPIKQMVDAINSATSKLTKLESELDMTRKAASQAAVAVSTVATTEASGDIPEGSVETVNAADLFGITGAAKDMFNFDVPKWKWDGVHPHVPQVDPDYIFRPEELLRVLFAIMTNQRAYLFGHSGTGKTTLIEQVCALLLWPNMRVNFDSEITRMDLIGRDTLTVKDGASASTFIDGILPQAMSGPYVLLCDEMDSVRPDVAYVMQRALEGNGLLLTEDGGRLVKPHPMFRMFATGNTQGQGDEHGMYPSCRPQSLALLDRFTVWSEVDYLDANQRSKLVKKKVPTLDPEHHKMVCQYVTEHLAAFKSAKILQPMSPRGMIALAQAVAIFASITTGKETEKAIKRGFGTVVLDRASSSDKAVISGIVDRVVAS